LRLVEEGVAMAFVVLLFVAYSSLAPELGVGIALMALAVYLRNRSPQDVAFFSTVAYTVPFAILLSSFLQSLIPASYEALAKAIAESPYFSSPVFALAVMGTALTSELVHLSRTAGREEATLHAVPYVVVSVALASLVFAVVYSSGFRLSPAVIPLLVLILGLLAMPSNGGKKLVVVECRSGPVRIVTEDGEIELWPNPITRLHDGTFRVQAEVNGKVKAVFVGNRKAKPVLSGSDGERTFVLYR